MDISCLPTLIEACGEIGLLLPAPMDAGGGSILGLALDGLWLRGPEITRQLFD